MDRPYARLRSWLAAALGATVASCQTDEAPVQEASVQEPPTRKPPTAKPPVVKPPAPALVLGTDHEGPDCGRDRLSLAVGELEDTQGNAAKNAIAAAAILDACPRSAFRQAQLEDLSIRSGRLAMADRTDVMLAPGEVERLWLMVCPEDRLDDLDPRLPAEDRGGPAYDICGWKKLRVADRSEMTGDVALGVTWSYYPVLRDHGVPHKLARPLVRALIFADVPPAE